jgi:transcriptional regulator with XRE-family HTH domain
LELNESTGGIMKRTGFGEPLRRLRQQHGLTQQEAADELIKLAWSQQKIHVGVDRQMVSK